jgi:hypothetical protein
VVKFILLFLLFILVGCDSKWTWKPDPYAADSFSAAIYSSNGEKILASDPKFSDFTCFSSQNMLELKQNIEELKIYKDNQNRSEVKSMMFQLNRAAKLPPAQDSDNQYVDMN